MPAFPRGNAPGCASLTVAVRTAIAAYAFVSSLVAFVVIGTGGLVLAGVENSGARGPGLMIAALAAGAFACALLLVFAPSGAFRGRARRPAGIAATFIAALPVGALGMAAILFVRLPFGSAMPRIEWPLFAAGLVLVLGALSVVALGYLRVTEGSGRAAGREPAGRPAPASAEVRRDAPRWEEEGARATAREEDEARVTRV